MSYVKSLRFKLMKLCVIPLVSVAFLFIAHSVVIANQVRDSAALAYQAAAPGAAVTLDLSWLTSQWLIVFGATFVLCFIPITISIKSFIMPIRALANHAESLAKGDVHIDVIKNRTDEIGILQEGFKELVAVSRGQAELLSRMAGGDFSMSYTPLSEDDLLGESIVTLLERNNTAMSQVLATSRQLAQATAQVADGAQALAAGSTEQAASVQELSSSISEIAAHTKENSSKAEQAAQLADTIKSSAETGSGQMDEMIKSVREINEASQSISKVIKTIDDIAFQTNILALNAAVEAARAGQHGKGFAVVAEEVRNLSAKSAQAAKDTETLIEDSMQKAQHGVNIANETAASLSSIVSGINESTALITEIARASEEQSMSISQINTGVDQVAKVVQQNSATAQESAAASEEMSSQSAELQELISQFKLRSDDAPGRAMTGAPARNRLAAAGGASFTSENSGNYGKY